MVRPRLAGSHGAREFSADCADIVAFSPDPSGDFAGKARILETLESGGVVLLPDTPFRLATREQALLDPELSDPKSKNISLDPQTLKVRGARSDPETTAGLGALLAHYAEWGEALIRSLLPRYAPSLERARTSFRPKPIGTFAPSVRKDDRRLHVDAFPSQPSGGRRILRLFSNVDPSGEARLWRLGEPFERFAARFIGRTKTPTPAAAWLSERLGVTRSRRSSYDELMLQLHDLAKRDEAYQASAPYRAASFPTGSSWIVFTDAVVHAAVGGRNALEQTFFTPVEAMEDEAASPLRVLERLGGADLV